MNDRKLPKGTTDEQLKALIAKHVTVHPITVTKDGQSYTALLKKPTIAVMAAATVASQATPGAIDVYKMGQVIYRSCMLVADPEIDLDEELLAGAMLKASQLFKAAQAELGEPYVAG
ncbi:MAG: hypothetical protein JNL05_10560 [Flavobacteriales bacterium]|nr:hypothetical protein [Flavobacteriales bacterium]